MKLPVILTSAALAAALTAGAQSTVIVETPAYSWHGDTISQGPFVATANGPFEIVSTYSAQPGYYMGIDKTWKRKNDISGYPQLTTPNMLHTAIYNMGLDEMVNAVEPDTTLRTGKEWAGVWTRDVSYSILLSMAYLQPEASRISLMHKVNPRGRIIQDTGSGGAWPVSTDRIIWAVAAYEVYKVTGDREWLKYIYPIIKNSLEDDLAVGLYDTKTGLVHGETSFIDWREQSYPKWMQTADIYQSQALGTSVVHAQAWKVLSEIAADLGHKDEARKALEQSQKIADGINRTLWLDDKGYYGMYLYGRDNLMMNPRAETLGEALAIEWDVASPERARTISSSNPTTPFGVAIFYPQIPDMPAYHNNALWPWVGAWWGLASAKAGNEKGVMQAIGAVFRPAALFATNKENFNLDNGDIATELNSSNMLWCLAGNLALTHRILFGINFEKDRLRFSPFVPEALGQDRRLDNFNYRGARLSIEVKGYGDSIASFTVNGKDHAPVITAAEAAKAAKKGQQLDIVITMDNQPIKPLPVNEVANVKAAWTPITRLDGTRLWWDPVEYSKVYDVYRDGKLVEQVRSTSYDASVPGEYQVVAYKNKVPGFASIPLSTRESKTFQIPGEGTAMTSAEILHQPKGKVTDFCGNGFVETDHKTAAVEVPFTVDADDTYSIVLRYANGNGPVNTGKSCAIRTVLVDGNSLGSVVMPHRGRGTWSDWGLTNSLDAVLTAGPHTLTVTFEPQNENMHLHTNHALIDELIVTRK